MNIPQMVRTLHDELIGAVANGGGHLRCREHQVRGGDADRGLAAACLDDWGARGCSSFRDRSGGR